MEKRKYYTAKEAARELNISKQTLLRYEKKGVFPAPKRNPVNKWREYDSRSIAELKKILGRR